MNKTDKYISNIQKNNDYIKPDDITTEIIVCIKRTIIELEEFEHIILSKPQTNIFPLIISGIELEENKNNIIKIKQKYIKY